MKKTDYVIREELDSRVLSLMESSASRKEDALWNWQIAKHVFKLKPKAKPTKEQLAQVRQSIHRHRADPCPVPIYTDSRGRYYLHTTAADFDAIIKRYKRSIRSYQATIKRLQEQKEALELG